MLHASEYFDAAKNGAMKELGIDVEPKLNLDQMHAQRRDAVKGLTGGIEFLFKKNKVDWKKGYATFQDAHTVKVGDETVTAKDIVIATGSSVTPLPGVEIDNDKHIVVELIDARVRAVAPRVYDIAVQGLSLFVMCLIVYVLFEAALHAAETNSRTIVLEWPLSSIFGVVAALAALSVVCQVLGLMTGAGRHDDHLEDL